MSKILAKNFEWETYDGLTEGTLDEGDVWSIEISARPTAKDIRWGSEDTNVRAWTLYRDYREVAMGNADGVRACKKEALDRLNQIVSAEEALKEGN